MADEFDPRLEGNLRDALRAEAEALPVRVRVSDLERIAVERARGRRSRRLGLLAAAASIAVVVGGAAILAATRPDGDVAASPTPAPAPAAAPELASYRELERNLVAGTNGVHLLARAEETNPDPSVVTKEVTLLTIEAVDTLQFEMSCHGGSYSIETREDGQQVFGFGQACDDQAIGITDGIVGEVRNVEVILRTTGPVAYRIVVGGWPPEGVRSPLIAPSEAEAQPGETALVSMKVVPGEPRQERTVEVPPGTDRYVLTAPCIGTGMLEVAIDGIQAEYACGQVGAEVFTLAGDGSMTIRARATGDAVFSLRIGAVDWSAIPGND